MLWVQVTEKAKFILNIGKLQTQKLNLKSKVVDASEEKYFTTQIALTNLLPGTNYQYEFLSTTKK